MNALDRDFSRLFLRSVGKPLRERVLLRNFSNFRIGGPADYFFEAKAVEELKSAIHLARGRGVPFYVVGGGFNLLFDDEGFRGLIVKNSMPGLSLVEAGSFLKASAGTGLNELVDFAAENGLEGLEFLAGIPGTVGGAVYGNAGAFGQCIGDFVENAYLWQAEGGEFRAPRDYFAFAYRYSRLKIKHDILLETVFRLRHGNKNNIRAKMKEYLDVRAEKHPPLKTACAGSYFKNPVLPDGTKAPAGYLLEQVGARELRVGGAAVYPGHSNFLINKENASARDVLGLARELKKRVRERFGIELEEEVIFLPASGSDF